MDRLFQGRSVLEVAHGAVVVAVFTEFGHRLFVSHSLAVEVVGAVVESLLLDLLLLPVDQDTLDDLPHILQVLALVTVVLHLGDFVVVALEVGRVLDPSEVPQLESQLLHALLRHHV